MGNVIYISCSDELTVIQHQIPFMVIWSTNPALIYLRTHKRRLMCTFDQHLEYNVQRNTTEVPAKEGIKKTAT